MSILTVMNAKAIAQNGNATSTPVNVDADKFTGSFSAQIALTGTGNVKVELLCTNDGTNYGTPTYGGTIASGLTAAANNHTVIPFSVPMCCAFTLKVTENNTAAITACTLTVACA